MQNAVRKPLKIQIQENGGLKHFGRDVNVILNEFGKVITTYATNHNVWRYR